MKNNKYIITKNHLLIITGIIVIITKKYINILKLISLFTIIYYIIKTIFSIKQKEFNYTNLIIIIINILLIISTKFSNIYPKLPITIIATYLLLIGLTRIITILIYSKTIKYKVSILINSIIYIFISIILYIKPINNNKAFTFILGIYLIILGNRYYINKIINKKIIKIPLIIQSIKPYIDFIKYDSQSNDQNNDNNYSLEILIHVRKNLRGIFGHTDIIFKDKVYSYGNYDKKSYKLIDAIGDGFLIETNKKQYINYCKSYGKRLFSFQIKLTDYETKRVSKQLLKIKNKTYKFSKKNIAKGSYIDKLNKNINVKFYKFKSGHYKYYFFLGYNCVKFIEEIISQNAINFNNIKTPGTLYNQLEKLRLNYSEKIKKVLY